MIHPSQDPIGAIFRFMIDSMRESADCTLAGECVHEHLNGACSYSEGVTQ